MSLVLLCLYGFIAMVIQDFLSTAQTAATTKGRAVLTGLLDVIGWLVTISTTDIAVSTLSGHDLAAKAAVIATISAANFLGSAGGVMASRRFIKTVKRPVKQPD